MTSLRIALMGAGLIGREHAALIGKHPTAELVGISDLSPEGQAYAGSIGVKHFADYDRMLDELQPDGAIVALPNLLHVEAGLACIGRKIPCLIEKPLAESVAAARELVDASERAGVPVLTGHHRRHSPDMRKARDAVRDGTLGDLVAVNGMWIADKPDRYFDVAWRRNAGGGPLLINLIHDIDCLRFICGEVESVKAFASNAVRQFEVEDTASISIRFESGALGTFLISDAAVSPYNWEVTSGQALYFPHQPGDYLHLSGRKAALAVPSMNLWRHTPADGNWQDPLVCQHLPLDGSRTYVNQLDHFLDVIRGNATPVINAREGMLTLATTLAVSKAAKEDRTVTVAEMLA